jgi:hypothetical protein
MTTAGRQLLTEARSLRASFPDPVAVGSVAISPLPDGAEYPALAAAMKHLRDEMLLVRAGQAGTIGVLDDEIAIVESLLARL